MRSVPVTAPEESVRPVAVDPSKEPVPSREIDREVIIDPDIELRDPVRGGKTRVRQWDLVAAIAAGGVLGAEARYGVGLLFPHSVGQIPWATVVVNATGCLLIGVLMVVLLELTSPHRLTRPFLGVGILGGYTTFSSFAMDTEQMILEHRVLAALLYVVITLATCAVAVWFATVLTRILGRLLSWAPSRRRREGSYR